MASRAELGQSLGLTISHIPEGRPNRSGSPLNPRFITVHNTSNTDFGADAEAHSRLVNQTGYYEHEGKKRWVSWHYTVDDDTCIRHLPLNEIGWHAGTREGNAESIGIEICMNKGIDQARAFDRAQRLIACLCHDLNLEPKNAIRAHQHWSGKACPTLLLDDGELGAKWEAFVAGVESYLKAIPVVKAV